MDHQCFGESFQISKITVNYLFFSFTKTASFNLKNINKIQYPDIRTILKRISHSDTVPYIVCPSPGRSSAGRQNSDNLIMENENDESVIEDVKMSHLTN